MNFQLVTGPAVSLTCKACTTLVIGGTEPYESASQGELVQPTKVYADIEGEEIRGHYCEECAAKLSVDDPTRSVNQFYTDTTGEEIDHKRLPDSE